jgi:hypothetical protein
MPLRLICSTILKFQTILKKFKPHDTVYMAIICVHLAYFLCGPMYVLVYPWVGPLSVRAATLTALLQCSLNVLLYLYTELMCLVN